MVACEEATNRLSSRTRALASWNSPARESTARTDARSSSPLFALVNYVTMDAALAKSVRRACVEGELPVVVVDEDVPIALDETRGAFELVLPPPNP